MSELLKYVLLGLLQGVTEFLPVSSSGHLVVLERLLAVDVGSGGMLLEVCLHLGTLAAVLIVFWRDAWRLLADGLRGALLWVSGRRSEIAQQAPHFPTALAILVGSVPAAIVGALLKLTLDERIKDVRLAGAMLIVTGLLLLSVRRAQATSSAVVGPRKGLLIGIAQAFALLPGISRSGTTIVAGCLLGLPREAAARFSFLLAIPAMLGAGVLEIVLALGVQQPDGVTHSPPFFAIACGTVVAALTGWACLVLLFRVVRGGRLHWFAAYCLPAGVLFLALGLFSGGGA